MLTYDEVVKEAFLDELQNIFAERGIPLDLEKVAGIGQALMGGLRRAGGAAQGGLQRAARAVSPTGRQLARYEAAGVGDVAQKALKASKPSARLQQWGQTMRQTPVQRVQAAGLKLAPGESAQITKATQQMGGTNLGKRLVGATAEGVGSHVAHKGALGLAINPIGVPLGGAIEGLTRQAGREAVQAGAQHAVAGRVGTGKMLGRLGGGLQRGAKGVGIAGEVAGLAGAGTALGAPVSAMGALGGKVLGAAGAMAPVIEHGLHGAGEFIHHGASDVAGMLSKRLGGGAAQQVGRGVAGLRRAAV